VRVATGPWGPVEGCGRARDVVPRERQRRTHDVYVVFLHDITTSCTAHRTFT